MCNIDNATCSDTRDTRVGPSICVKPFDILYKYDILAPQYDMYNTRMFATLYDIGIPIERIGKSYSNVKYNFFTPKNQHNFHVYMDTLRCGIESARHTTFENLTKSKTLQLHSCDFNTNLTKLPMSKECAHLIFTFLKPLRDYLIPFEKILESIDSEEQAMMRLTRGNLSETWKMGYDIIANVILHTRNSVGEQRMNGESCSMQEHLAYMYEWEDMQRSRGRKTIVPIGGQT